jgi:sorting nexin-1/2
MLIAIVLSEMATAIAELAETLGALASSDLSKQLSYLLGILADLQKKAKEMQDVQAKDDVVTIMGTGQCYLVTLCFPAPEPLP